MANIFKKIFTHKRICAFFAIATAMPFLSIIATNTTKKLEDIFKADAAKDIIDLYDGQTCAFLAPPDSNSYYDIRSKMAYAQPEVSATGDVTCTVEIRLTKQEGKTLTATYHVENFTAILGEDYELPYKTGQNTITIPAQTTTAKITIKVKQKSPYGVGSKDEKFRISRCFRVVLDRVQDSGGNDIIVYDGNDNNGYHQISGKLYKNDVYGLCGYKYEYETMKTIENSLKDTDIQQFVDYYDYQYQQYGVGAGSTPGKDYDPGGRKQYSNAEYKWAINKETMDDDEDGRHWHLAGGGFQVVPTKFMCYYYDQNGYNKRIQGPYRDWLNRIVKTGLGHAYGSFNVERFNDWQELEDESFEHFYLGDAKMTHEVDCFGSLFQWADRKDYGVDDSHWNVTLKYYLDESHSRDPSGSDDDDIWCLPNSSLELFEKYMKDNRTGNTNPKAYAPVSGMTFNNKLYNYTDFIDNIRTVQYDHATQTMGLGSYYDNNRITWFKLPHNDDEETWGMTLIEQHDYQFWWLGYRGMKGTTYFGVLDDAAPKLSAPAVYEKQTLGKSQKVRLTVCFSEPVQNFEHSFFKAKCSGGSNTTAQEITFRPVEGQMPGCDRVVYDADTHDLVDIHVKRMSISSNIQFEVAPEGFDQREYKIRDFAQSGGNEMVVADKSGYLSGQDYAVNINKKNPAVIPYSDGTIKKAAKNAVASISVSGMSDGKIYYCFMKDTGSNLVFPMFSDKRLSSAVMYSDVKYVSALDDPAVVQLEMPASTERTGDFYCFVKLHSSLDQEATFPVESMAAGIDPKKGIGPFKIDNEPPKIIIEKGDPFNANERKFIVKVEENCGIEKVRVSFNKTAGLASETINQFDVKVTQKVAPTEEGETPVYEGSFTLTLNDILDKYYSVSGSNPPTHIFNPDLEYENFSFKFDAIDNAGNQTSKWTYEEAEGDKAIIVPFSAHPNLPAFLKTTSKEPLMTETGVKNLYPAGTSFTFSTSLDTETVGYLEASVIKLPMQDQIRGYSANFTDTRNNFVISQGSPAQKNQSIVTLNDPGYYELIIRNLEENYSDSFKFYITNNFTEQTTNYYNAIESPFLMPKNIAWQLNDTSMLYYLDSNGVYRYKSYNGISDPLFSGVNAAKQYCLTHEYEDLKLVKLDMGLANILEEPGGVSGGYIKATGEGTTARAGQWWVRYKNANWTIGSQTSTSWAYYFYSETSNGKIDDEFSIDLDGIASNNLLATRLDEVATTLAQNGKEIYLVDDAHLDSKTGAPYLSAGQKAVTQGFEVNVSLSGSPISSIICPADTEMFSNEVTAYDGHSYSSYRLCSNMPLIMDDETTLYYRPVIGDGSFTQINCKDGTILKQALDMNGVAPSGIYELLEISSVGASLFKVYIDKDNPEVKIERTIYDPLEEGTVSATSTVDGQHRIDFYSKEFQVDGFAEGSETKEVDGCAYVAIFQKNKLVVMKYLNTMTTPIYLQSGIYDVVIGDRSGNSFSFRTYVSEEDIEVSYKVNGDSSKLTISVTNREESELLSFDVYCDGELVESNLSNPKSFVTSGMYYAIVQDQYGNRLTSEPFMFSKISPEIKIWYIDKGFTYEYKANEDPPHIIKSSNDEGVLLQTCSLLKFEYDATEIGVTINCPVEDAYTHNTKTGTIIFNQLVDYSFNIYYLDSPNEYVKYTVIYDDREPTIMGQYTTSEYNKLDETSSGFDVEKQVPKTLDYTVLTEMSTGIDVKSMSDIEYGEKISTDLLYFVIDDNTFVKSVMVYYNGISLPVQILDTDDETRQVFYVSAIPGEYVVTAYDAFGMSTSLMFHVNNDSSTIARVDGNLVNPVGPLGPLGHQTIYGNTGAEIVCPGDATISVRYEDDTQVYAYVLQLQDNLMVGSYVFVSGEGGSGVKSNYNPVAITEKEYYPIEGVDLAFIVNDDGTVTIKYNANPNKVTNLDVRTSIADENFSLYNMEFSKGFTEPSFLDKPEDKEIVITPRNGYVYASKYAHLVDTANEYVEVLIAYNAFEGVFNNEDYVPYTPEYVFDNGFYCYRITNKYGNVKEYVVIVSDTIECTITLTFYDKENETYSGAYGTEFESNNSISVSCYNVESLTEAAGRGLITDEGDKTTITFSNPGIYYVAVKDNNNNVISFVLTINSEIIEYDEYWLVGYNEDALLRNEGYTNQPLSIDLTQNDLDNLGISQIYYKFEGEKTVIYGYSGNDINLPYDPEAFKDVIGSKGDGVYMIYFSNEFGDVCYKTIHFKQAATLEVSRTTTLAIDPEAIDLNDAIANEIWSNISVQFNSTLDMKQYRFYVKSGDDAVYAEQNIGYLFELSNASAGGEIHYFVKYIDAFGNIYEIKVNLLRRDVLFDMKNLKLVTTNNANYTKENFLFEYDPTDVSIIYSFNGVEQGIYSPSQLMFKDGTYEFTMFDKSGNQNVFIITKDSVVSFDLVVDGQTTNAYYGCVINGKAISIRGDDREDIELVSAKRDGNIISVNEVNFTKSGHYEFLIEDFLGNIKYFHCYLISNELSSFEYTIPNDYYVSSAYYINSQGIKVTSMNKVDSVTNTINLNDSEEGTYEFQIKNQYNGAISNFTVIIDRTVPTAELVGCADGDVTTKTVTIGNVKTGDIITVYRDGEVVQRVEASGSKSINDITEGGKYKIVVENKAGSVIEFNFEKLTIANGALSALVIIGLLAVSGGFLVVLLLRNRSKSDE